MNKKPTIFNIADITNNTAKIEEAKKEELIAAQEHCQKEIDCLNDFVDKFCNAIDDKFIISNIFSISNNIREMIKQITEVCIRPYIDGSDTLKEELGESEYLKTRKDIYKTIIKRMKENDLI